MNQEKFLFTLGFYIGLVEECPMLKGEKSIMLEGGSYGLNGKEVNL